MTAPPLTCQSAPGPLAQRAQLAFPNSDVIEARVRDDGRVFVCSSRRGLHVVDDGGAKGLSLAGSVEPVSANEGCQHLGLDGDTAFVTFRGWDAAPAPVLTAIRIDGAQPAKLDAFMGPVGDDYEGVAAAGGMVYVAMHARGLAVFDHRSGKFVRRGVAIGLRDATGVAVAGSRVFVADGKGGLAVVDAANPDAPQVIGTLALDGDAQDLTVVGNTVYVAAGSGGLLVVDVTDPKAPKLVGAASVPGAARAVSVANGHAYVADWLGVRAFTVDGKSAPVAAGGIHVPPSGKDFTRVLGVTARGDDVFLAEWQNVYAYRFTAGVRAPGLAVADEMLQFGSVAAGQTATRSFIVTNDGALPLSLCGADVAGSGFSVGPLPSRIEAGGHAVLAVHFVAGDAASATGTLTLRTNAPAELPHVIPLSANSGGVTVGTAAPEVAATLVDGTAWHSKQELGKVVVIAYFATF